MGDEPSTRASAGDPNARSFPAVSPDLDATGSGAPLPSRDDHAADERTSGRETQEREAAWRRGRERRTAGVGRHVGGVDDAEPALAHRAFIALAENVRDYAIFLLDPDGIIRYWGEGAHLLKRWSRAQAEGAHLRLLYVDGGSEDGTAEDHVREAAEYGESVGQGRRVREDGSTFWAHVTLTALKSDDGTLLGFAKVTRDLTAQHAAEAALARAADAAELHAAHGERANMVAEIAVLKEELAVLTQELRHPGGSDAR